MSRISIEFVFGFLFFFCFFFRKRQRKTSTASTQSATSARPSKKTKTSSVSEEPAQPAAAAPPTQLARLQVVPSFSFLFLPGFHPQPLSDIDTLSFVDSVGMYWETRSIGVVWLLFFSFFSRKFPCRNRWRRLLRIDFQVAAAFNWDDEAALKPAPTAVDSSDDDDEEPVAEQQGSELLPSFTGFYWVLPGFYRALPSLTGFHRV